MNKTDEALKLALEALKPLSVSAELRGDNLPEGNEVHKMADAGFKAITACEQALAAQPAPVPLTDEQINNLRQQYGVTSDGRGIKEFTYVVDFARAIEAAHGITKGQA
jgi:hypothetical protein